MVSVFDKEKTKHVLKTRVGFKTRVASMHCWFFLKKRILN